MSLNFLVASSLLLILSTTVAMAAPKNDPKDTEIENAYEDPATGRLIIRFKYRSKMFDKDKANPDFFGNNQTFYGTEKNLFQLEERNFGGSSDSYRFTFADDRVQRSKGDTGGDFYAGIDQGDMSKKSSKYTVVCGDQSKTVEYKPLSKERIAELQKIIQSGKAPLTPLPTDIRKPEYIFKKADGTVIYVDASKYNYSSYDSFRLFVGKPGAMNEKKVKGVERIRHGETYIKTGDGESLISPLESSKDKKPPTWNGVEMERVDSRNFDFASLGIKGVPSEGAELHTPCDKFFPVKAVKGSPNGNGDGSAEKEVKAAR